MHTSQPCPECGAPLPDEAADGSCPVCVFQGALALSNQAAEAFVPEEAGDQIGPYLLVEKLGEGGCGIVYLAQQLAPIRRQVALKIVKLGMDTRQVIARFENERQALALMDHPHIARVFDAAATNTGRPYFVMELVPGLKITEYCDREQLSVRERLELFRQVCHAVQHAHQKGIIHRDLKPSNILVTRHNNFPEPKIIDFGIAKATQAPLNDHTSLTALQQFIGTPAYMSPEQAAMGAMDIDTRSDIYALGVLLYELLTGHVPFARSELLDEGFDEIRRLIREQEPPRPSTRLTMLAAAELTAVARHRQSEPHELISLMRDDLDWIVMKCLEKDRARRYGTADGLARDVERHSKNEPVIAAAPTTVYRLAKFFRRHRFGLATGAALVLLLIAGSVVSTDQAVRATRAERKQSQLRLEADKAREEAEAQRRRVEIALNEEATQRSRAQSALQDAQRQKAEKEKAFVESQIQRTNALASLAIAEREKARAEDAFRLASNATAQAESALRSSREQQARLEQTLDFMLFDLSDKLRPAGHVDLLRSVTDKVLAHYQSLSPEDQSGDSLTRRLTAFKNLGHVLALQGDSAKAIEAYQTSLEIAQTLAAHEPGSAEPGSAGIPAGERVLPLPVPAIAGEEERGQRSLLWQGELAVCHARIGELWQARGDPANALAEFDQSVKISHHLAAQEPRNPQWQAQILASSINRGDALKSQSDRTNARAAYQTALTIALQLSQNDPQNILWQRDLSASYLKVGSLLLEQRAIDLARENCSKALELAQRLAAKEPADARWQSHLAMSHDSVGDVFLACKEDSQALEHYQEALRTRQHLAQTDPANTEWQRDLLRSYFKVARALASQNKKSKVLELFQDRLKEMEQTPKKHLEFARQLFSTDKRKAQSLAALYESLNLARQLADKDPANVQWQDDVAKSHSFVGDLLLEERDNEATLQQYQAALQIRLRLAKASPESAAFQYDLALAHANVATILRRLERPDEASLETCNALRVLTPLAAQPNPIFADPVLDDVRRLIKNGTIPNHSHLQQLEKDLLAAQTSR